MFQSLIVILSFQTGQLFGAPDQDQSSTRSCLSCPHISAEPSIQVCIHIHFVTALNRFFFKKVIEQLKNK